MVHTVDWDKKGIIFDIQHFSVHDGSGIRTMVFFKGCPLRCKWCSNPESHMIKKQVMFIKNNCIDCCKCIDVCPTGAVKLIRENKMIDAQCRACGKCVEVCHAGALKMVGENVTVKDVVKEIKKDAVYYRRSGGGVTLSGGESLMQSDFAVEVLKACKNNGWNTVVETTAFVEQSVLEKVLPYLDLILLDIKSMDDNIHKEYTGQSNKKILENAKFISDKGKRLIIRIPIIPNINDTIENIRNTAVFAKKLSSIEEVNLLPYHRLGVNKYSYLGYKYELEDIEPPSKDIMERLKKVVEKEGLICKVY